MSEIKIIHGTASDEEIAALVAALALEEPADEPRRPLWTDRARLTPGPGAWRASGLPLHKDVT